jgi:hypothetical protein
MRIRNLAIFLRFQLVNFAHNAQVSDLPDLMFSMVFLTSFSTFGVEILNSFAQTFGGVLTTVSAIASTPHFSGCV